jgi:tellurite resistance protein
LIGLPRTPAANQPGAGVEAAGATPGGGGGAAAGPPADVGDWTRGSANETATVREIVAQLDSMPPDEARFLAGFAYILSRAANADLHVTDDETRRMEEIVVTYGRIPEPQAVIVVQIAKTRAELFGPTEDYLVTREFKRIATDEQCVDVLRCCFLVSASDGSITADESGTLSSIADELGVDQGAVRRLRGEFAEQSAALQAMRRRST